MGSNLNLHNVNRASSHRATPPRRLYMIMYDVTLFIVQCCKEFVLSLAGWFYRASGRTIGPREHRENIDTQVSGNLIFESTVVLRWFFVILR